MLFFKHYHYYLEAMNDIVGKKLKKAAKIDYYYFFGIGMQIGKSCPFKSFYLPFLLFETLFIHFTIFFHFLAPYI